MTGTKKQKMDMSKAIVKAIYSKEPPGRFLKKCPGTGQWEELSKKEAADKAAQAMAYAVTRESLKQKRRERRLRSCPFPSFQQQDDVGAASSQNIDQPTQIQSHTANNHLDGGSSSAAGLAARGRRVSSNNNTQPAGETLPGTRTGPGTSNLQQQLLQLQQQSNTTTVFPAPTTSGINSLNNPDGSVQALAQIQILQLQRQRQMELLLHSTLMRQHPPASLEELTQLLNQMQQQLQEQLLLQHALSQHMQPNPLTSLSASASFPPTLSLSAPAPSTAPSLSDQRVLQSNQHYLTGSQLATNNILQNPVQVQSQSNPSNNAYLLSMLSNLQNQSNVGTASGGPGDVLQTQNQLLDSSLSNSWNNHLPLQQQPQHQP